MSFPQARGRSDQEMQGILNDILLQAHLPSPVSYSCWQLES